MINDEVLSVSLRIDSLQAAVEHSRKLGRHDDVTARLQVAFICDLLRNLDLHSVFSRQELSHFLDVILQSATLADLFVREEAGTVEELALVVREVEFHFRVADVRSVGEG